MSPHRHPPLDADHAPARAGARASARPRHGGFVAALGDVTEADVTRVGRKAASLGALLRAGFPVPEGVILTTHAFAHALDGLRGAVAPEAFARSPLPRAIAHALWEAADVFGGAPLAVRSSAVAEDLRGASFAGQYATVLHVRGRTELEDAVRRCWASAFGAHLAVYREGRGLADASGMAVLVQRLVAADAAGVAFSANPVTGDRDECLVSAVRGLGERLVSGRASPDEWVVGPAGPVRTCGPEDAITAAQALEVAALARRCERELGSPQDVEWAIAAGRLHLLQSRPITALGEPAIPEVPMRIDPPPGYWELDAEHMPKPLTPMTRSLVLPMQTAGMERMCAVSGLLLRTLEFRDIGGWMYMRLVPLAGGNLPPPPPWALRALIRIHPALRGRIRRGVEFIRNGEVDELVRRWYQEWHPEMQRRIEDLRAVVPAALSDEALQRHLTDTFALMARGCEVHFTLACVNPFVMYELLTTCADLLDLDEASALELVAGLSTKSTEPSRRLGELAAMARERPALRAALEHADRATPDVLGEIDPEFAAALAAYQRDYGCRALAFDLVEPTIAESPGLVLGWIRDQLATGYDAAGDRDALERRRGAAQEAARARLRERPRKERERFERALARAIRAYPAQEDNVFSTWGVPAALGRLALLELGERLARAGAIARGEDVFFLEVEEARRLLAAGGGDARALVRRRKGERCWAEAHPGPLAYGRRPAEPSLDALPPECRYLMSVVPWYLQRALSTGRGRVQEAGTRIKGIGASPGRSRGTVRVIASEREFERLRPGEVLVCPATTPMWSVLFSSICALVTNTGGILSHPAIIAREYRVPAVVATGNATSLLRDGDTVVVDGDAGWVEVVP